MDFAGRTDSGPRPANEDSYWCCDLSQNLMTEEGLTAFVMISDGMGGHDAGDVASALAVQTAQEYISVLQKMSREGGLLSVNPEMALCEIARNASDAICAENARRGTSHMGATFIGAFLSLDRVWIGHVGDSRAYLIRGGTIEQLTTDHSLVGRMYKKGVLTEEEAQNHPERNKIERALGFSSNDPEITIVDTEQYDIFLLCSDGVSTVLNCADLLRCCKEASSIAQVADSVISSTLASNTDDNATVVVCAPDLAEFTPHQMTQSIPIQGDPMCFSSPNDGQAAPKWKEPRKEEHGAILQKKPIRFAMYAAIAIIALLAGLLASSAIKGITAGDANATRSASFNQSKNVSYILKDANVADRGLEARDEVDAILEKPIKISSCNAGVLADTSQGIDHSLFT